MHVTLTSDDTLSGVEATYYRIDGGDEVALHRAPSRYSAEGTTTIEYYSVDVVGNTERRQHRDRAHRRHGAGDQRRRADRLGQRTGRRDARSRDDTLSGVEATYYRIDGGDRRSTTAPFEISAEGTTTIEYYSVDVVGNTEARRTPRLVRIDDTAPVTQ